MRDVKMRVNPLTYRELVELAGEVEVDVPELLDRLRDLLADGRWDREGELGSWREELVDRLRGHGPAHADLQTFET